MDSLHDSVPDIAVHGEGGIDVFRRKAGAEAATGRFDCLCTLVPLPQGGHRMIAHSGTARHAREAIELARDRLAATPGSARCSRSGGRRGISRSHRARLSRTG